MIQALYNFASFTILVMVGMILLVTLITIIYNLSNKDKRRQNLEKQVVKTK